MTGGPTVCVVGSINQDLVVHAPRLPLPGETLIGGPFEVHPGGKGANQAVAAARLGASVSMVGAVGADPSGAALLEALEQERVDVSNVSRRSGVATGVGVISVSDADGENSIIVAPGANHEVGPSDIDAAAGVIEAADVLVLQLEVPMASISRAACLAKAAGTTVILNARPCGAAR